MILKEHQKVNYWNLFPELKIIQEYVWNFYIWDYGIIFGITNLKAGSKWKSLLSDNIEFGIDF